MARRRPIPADAEVRAPSRRRRKRRFVVRAAGLVALLGLVATLALPAILGSKALCPLLFDRLVPQQCGRLRCDQVQLSWTGSQHFSGVRFADSQGEVVFSAPTVVVGRSLASLIGNPYDLGQIVVTQPTATLVTRPQGSNLEDLWAAWSESRRQTSQNSQSDKQSVQSSPLRAELQLAGGGLLGRDAATGEKWQLSEVSLTALYDASVVGGTVWKVNGQAAAIVADSSTSNVDLPGAVRWGIQPTDDGGARVELVCDRLPLAPFGPWLSRWQPEVRLSGSTSADVQLQRHAVIERPTVGQASVGQASVGQKAGWSLVGKATLSSVRFTSARLLGESLQVDRGALDIDGTFGDGVFQAKRFRIDSEWLAADWHGRIDRARLAQGNWQTLPNEWNQFNARIDLSALSHMAPRSLRLRPGVTIDSGSAEISLKSSEGAPNPAWRIAASIQDVRGSDGTRKIRWTDAMEAAVDVQPSPEGAVLERAVVRSPFVGVALEKQEAGYAGNLEFDLDRLTAQLGQLIDLSSWRLVGTGAGSFNVTSRDSSSGKSRYLVASARIDAEKLEIAFDQQLLWRDAQLRLDASAESVWEGLRPTRFDKGRLTVDSPQQTLQIELIEALDLTRPSLWAARIEAGGPLESWRRRLAVWNVDLPPDLSGEAQLRGQVHSTPQSIEVKSLEASATRLHVTLSSATITEPQIELAGDFRYLWESREASSASCTLQGSSLALQARNVAWMPTENGLAAIRGEAAFRGDLERLSAWFGMTKQASGWPRGQGVGQIRLTSDAAGARVEISAVAEPLEWVALATESESTNPRKEGSQPTSRSAPIVQWSEPRVEIEANGSYDAAEDRLALQRLRLKGNALELDGDAEIDSFSAARQIRGRASVQGSQQQIAAWTAHYLGPGIAIQGATAAKVRGVGPVGAFSPAASLASATSARAPDAVANPWWHGWKIQSETALEGVTLYGLPIGAAQLSAELSDDRISFQPMEAVAGGGKISLQPLIVLSPQATHLELPGGPLATRVEISQPVSEAMLKYAAPVLAGATRAEGTFSVELDRFVMPLKNRQETQMAGRLMIHRLNVSPGPLLQELVTTIQQVEALTHGAGGVGGGAAERSFGVLTASEKSVDIQVVKGRVYHRGLEFLIDDVPVRSYGSVGFDDTLALVIEIPVQEKWVRRQRALQPLAGKIIEIPVHGTLEHPRLDREAIANLSQQLLQGVAEKYIGDEVNRALNRLLKPR